MVQEGKAIWEPFTKLLYVPGISLPSLQAFILFFKAKKILYIICNHFFKTRFKMASIYQIKTTHWKTQKAEEDRSERPRGGLHCHIRGNSQNCPEPPIQKNGPFTSAGEIMHVKHTSELKGT